MVFKSNYPLDYPKVSLSTFIFESPTAKLSDEPLYIDAEDPSHYHSHASIRLLSQRWALGIQRNGLNKSDRVLLFSGNNIYFPAIVLGTVMAGGIFSGANPTYVARELAYQLTNSGAKFLICALESLDTGLAAAAEAGIARESVYYFNNSVKPHPLQKGCRHWSEILANEDDAKNFAWGECKTDGDMDQTIVLNYSSGTTGRSKGVEITHRNYISNNTVQEWLDQRKEETLDKAAPPSVHLCFLPMYHAMAQSQAAIAPGRHKRKTYIMPKFDFVKMMNAIEKYKVTVLVLVPPIVIAMAKSPDVRAGKWDLSSLRDVSCGAAPLGRPEAELFESLWKGLPQEKLMNVKQGWGMTEVTCRGTFSDPRRFHSTNTVGELSPGCEARIVKEDGSGDGAVGERGEIWIRGPNIMKGYWRNPTATAETLTSDGWLRSGDIAYIDKAGQFYIVDRMKELIKVKGNQVAPAELESLLQGHPQINDVAVIGVPYQGDEAPRAYVVAKPESKPVEGEIMKWLNAKVSKTKRLVGGVRFVDAIPKNPSGKILRRQLRDLAAKQDAQQAKL